MYSLKSVLLFSLELSLILAEPGGISKKKCEEYSKFVFADEHSPVLHVETKIHSVSKCGIIEIPLIIGGMKAAQNEFPHMTIIGFARNTEQTVELSWDCGGTLISENFVLTAAHCLTNKDKGEAQRVRIGMISLKHPSIHMQEIGVTKRIQHPEYASRPKYNDIGLLKLTRKISFNEHVHPACINTDVNIKWTHALATGFGRLTYEGETGSVDLMKVQLNNIDEKDCRETYKSFRSMSHGIKESQFCAGVMAGKKDTCQGDSGGPLQIVLDQPYCMYHVIGITSFGKFCGFENSPGVYTRVASYIEWIENNVWE